MCIISIRIFMRLCSFPCLLRTGANTSMILIGITSSLCGHTALPISRWQVMGKMAIPSFPPCVMFSSLSSMLARRRPCVLCCLPCIPARSWMLLDIALNTFTITMQPVPVISAARLVLRVGLNRRIGSRLILICMAMSSLLNAGRPPSAFAFARSHTVPVSSRCCCLCRLLIRPHPRTDTLNL